MSSLHQPKVRGEIVSQVLLFFGGKYSGCAKVFTKINKQIIVANFCMIDFLLDYLMLRRFNLLQCWYKLYFQTGFLLNVIKNTYSKE